MSALRDCLRKELTKKVDGHGLVVWHDEAEEYVEVASEVAPPSAQFVPWDRSWYALRREIEENLAGEEPPRLLVYAPGRAPAEDPLAEIREAGAVFTIRLRTLIRRALEGELTEARLEEIGRDSRTIGEAEAAIHGGGDGVDVRLIAVLGSADQIQIGLRILGGSYDAAITKEESWEAVSRFLTRVFGGGFGMTGDSLREELVRQLVLSAIEQYAGALPEALAPARWRVDTEHRRRSVALLEAFSKDTSLAAVFRDLAERADRALELEAVLQWKDGMEGCIATAGLEAVAFREALNRLGGGDPVAAATLARARLEKSFWTAPGDATRWGERWRALAATADLRQAVHEHRPPRGGQAALLDWYVSVGWRIDRAHRRMEAARAGVHILGDLDTEITAARAEYEGWLDSVLSGFASSLAAEPIGEGSWLDQGEIHDRFVAGRDGRVAYIWVDALRYELGVELAEALRKFAPKVELHAALAAAPTITPVGMANLLPDAASRLSLRVDGDQLKVMMNETEVATRKGRMDLLRAAYGAIVESDLNDALQGSEAALKKSVENTSLFLVTCQEIDKACEAGLLAVSWSQMDAVRDLMAGLVARLGQAGVRRIVITADHGFVALSRDLARSRVIDAPIGGNGELHRRAWVGRGGTTPDGTVRVPLSNLGIAGGLDLVVPKGLAVLRGGGDPQFFHGGLSPQELVIPVIVVDIERAAEPQKLDLQVSVAGGRIVTGMFAASLSFRGDLFTRSVTVRAVARGREKRLVARVVSGDGYDAESGTVNVSVDAPTVLAFQVTTNLDAGTEVEVQVLDARTGKDLGSVAVPVAARVTVEEEL